MKQHWTEEELKANWQILPNEKALIKGKQGATRLGFAILLKYFQHEGQFPGNSMDIPSAAIFYLADQVGVSQEMWFEYPWEGRAIGYHRATIRSFCGFREATLEDGEKLEGWLVQEVLPKEHLSERIQERAFEYCRQLSIEPPGQERLKRIILNAVNRQEILFCERVFQRLKPATIEGLEALLQTSDEGEKRWTAWQNIKNEPGKASLESINEAAFRLTMARKIGIPSETFQHVPQLIMEKYAKQAAVKEPHELRRHARPLKITILAIFIYRRIEELTDHLVDLLVETVHRMGKKAETKIEHTLGEVLQRAPQKIAKLYLMAKAAIGEPQGVVREVIYPAAPEKWLLKLIQEVEGTGSGYKGKVRGALHRSYLGHYRRMLPELLNNLEFQCSHRERQPVMQAIDVIKRHLEIKGTTYPTEITVPIDGIVPSDWRPLVIDHEGGVLKINRTAYEICVLKILRDRLRCREIWVVGSRRYRNPEEDLPQDFETNREAYYTELGIPLDPKLFIKTIQEEMARNLNTLNKEIPTNEKVKIVSKKDGFRLCVSPLESLPDPENIVLLKQEIVKRWSGTSLLDVLKETDLRVNFTKWLQSGTDPSRMDKVTLQRRLLLCLFALGTNAGMKSMESKPHDDYKDLLYIHRRFFSINGLRQAIASVVNETFRIRQPHIWGEATTACASDSKQFGAWDENLLTEWHVRYGGRGVMVYWHVEEHAVCIYSQFKRVSSSEVGAMINGVLRHCTEMEVDRQYVDSHGQSTIAFAFCRLLGFELMPRLKGIDKQKLYSPESGLFYPNLDEIISSKMMNWKILEENLDGMVKHVVALKFEKTDAESLLRRFTKKNSQHPIYKAFAELGKAIKTIFLCRYLASKALRREIDAGLNVVETWNGTNDFIFFGKSGELATNQQEEQEMGLLCLHLLQSSLVFINTLMIQRVLQEPEWTKIMTERDLAALSPLMTQHINKFGRFEVDLEKRILFDFPAS